MGARERGPFRRLGGHLSYLCPTRGLWALAERDGTAERERTLSRLPEYQLCYIVVMCICVYVYLYVGSMMSCAIFAAGVQRSGDQSRAPRAGCAGTFETRPLLYAAGAFFHVVSVCMCRYIYTKTMHRNSVCTERWNRYFFRPRVVCVCRKVGRLDGEPMNGDEYIYFGAVTNFCFDVLYGGRLCVTIT